MIAVGHTASGALVGLAGFSIYHADIMPDALLVFLTAFAAIGAHYAGDWLPHGHYQFDLARQKKSSIIKLCLDLGLSVLIIMTTTLVSFGASMPMLFIAVGIIGSNTPDVFEGLIDLRILPNNNFSRRHRAWHYENLHWHRLSPTPSLPSGTRPLSWIDIYQFVLFATAVWLIGA